jgi:hypothetical protein
MEEVTAIESLHKPSKYGWQRRAILKEGTKPRISTSVELISYRIAAEMGRAGLVNVQR